MSKLVVASDERSITNVDDVVFVYTLERKQIKNINIRIHPDGKIFVSAAKKVSQKAIEDFLLSKSRFILKTVSNFNEKRKYAICEKQYVSGESFYLLGRHLRLCVIQSYNDVVEEDGVYLNLYCKHSNIFLQKKRLVERYFQKKCEEIFPVIIKEKYTLFQKYGIPFPSLKIRTMKSRWGSCIPSKNIITLNALLIHFSQPCIEYVVIHELCHFLYANHSKKFYTLMTVFMPEWRDRKKELESLIFAPSNKF